MKAWIVVVSALAVSSGCVTQFKPISPGEAASGYAYIPVDPTAVETEPGDSCMQSSALGQIPNANGSPRYRDLLESFPDNAVRVAIEQYDSAGAVTYGASKASGETSSYKVTVDYVNVDTTNISLWISKEMESRLTTEYEPVSLMESNPRRYRLGSERYSVSRSAPTEEKSLYASEFNIPVYVGVGLRVTANIDSAKANANISGLGVIGAEAESGNVKGTLVVQTLGINGKSIAAALPIQSELNRTTAQNAVVSVGAIKALIYEDETFKSPRVVGIYLPFAGGKPLVNAIISELSKKRVPWRRPCQVGGI